ncbi:MAG: OmpA family protein [bacterium]|nr:OmpA family protein [bacterium]
MKKVIMFSTLVILVLIYRPAGAGWLGDTLNSAIKGAGKDIVYDAVDSASGSAYRKVKNNLAGEASGNPDTAVRPDAEAAAGVPAFNSPEGTIRGEERYSRFDFIPGSKVLFFDDFSDTEVGGFPMRWTLEGPNGGGNTLDVISWAGSHYFRSRPAGGGNGQSCTGSYLRLKGLKDLPRRFTIEFDAILAGEQTSWEKAYGILLLSDVYDPHDSPNPVFPGNSGTFYFSDIFARSAHSESEFLIQDQLPHHIAITVDGTAAKAYVDGDLVINDPEAVNRPISLVGMYWEISLEHSVDWFMFTNFRLAEGGKEFGQVLETDGRFIAPGIRFDTGSAILLPESLPTLRSIQALLQEQPSLPFLIEGHTDNQGGDQVNEPLSQERAEAVRDWLMVQGIEPNRLVARGFGSRRPRSTNDNPEGRSLNRRVEFVRQ